MGNPTTKQLVLCSKSHSFVDLYKTLAKNISKTKCH